MMYESEQACIEDMELTETDLLDIGVHQCDICKEWSIGTAYQDGEISYNGGCELRSALGNDVHLEVVCQMCEDSYEVEQV